MVREVRWRHKSAANRVRYSASSRLMFETLEPRLALDAGPLVISEFMAVNGSVLTDADRDFSDWIEVYNPGSEPINLGGWHLTDEATRPARRTCCG